MTYDSSVLADGAVAYWKMGESAFPLVDSAGSHNITAPSGSGPYALGVSTSDDLWKACDLQGGPYFDTGYTHSGAMALTYECWALTLNSSVVLADARVSAVPGVLFALGSGFQNKGAGTPYVGWDADNVAISRTGPNNYADGTWHHLACTWQGATGAVAVNQFAFYVDGSRADTSYVQAGTANSPLNSSTVRIGNNASPGSVVTLNRFAIYPTALAAGTLNSHYMLGKAERSQLTGIWG